MTNLPANPDPTLDELERRVTEGAVMIGEALGEIRVRRLYLDGGYKSFDDYCREQWGIAGRTALRKIEQAIAVRALGPGEPVPSQRALARGRQPDAPTYPVSDARDNPSSAPDVIAHTVTNRPLDAFGPDAVLPPGARPPLPASAPPAPREAAQNGSGRVVQSPAPIAQPRPAERPITDAEGLRWLTSKTTAQIRALGDPYGPATRAEICRWAEAFGYDRHDVMAVTAAVAARRQGTITCPADRVVATSNGACSHPKAKQRNTGYAVICDACHVRVR